LSHAQLRNTFQIKQPFPCDPAKMIVCDGEGYAPHSFASSPLSRRTDSISVRTFAISVPAIIATSIAIGYLTTRFARSALLEQQQTMFEATLASRATSIVQTLATMRGQASYVLMEETQLTQRQQHQQHAGQPIMHQVLHQKTELTRAQPVLKVESHCGTPKKK
jgi:hypothetical protein